MEELVTVDCGLWKFKTPRNSGRAKFGKDYESVKVKFFEDHIKPGDTFVDIGACEGFFTLMAMQFTGREGHVIAFEPDPENYNLLTENVKLNSHFFGLDGIESHKRAANSRILAVRLAASNSIGYKEFYRGVKPGMHSLISGLKHRSNEGYTKVGTTRLDDFSFLDTPNGMKIDVEGAELQALYGSEELLQIPELRYIAIDVHPSLTVFGSLIKNEVEERLLEAGFRIVYFEGQGNEVFGVKE